jgi:hypothetical protein
MHFGLGIKGLFYLQRQMAESLPILTGSHLAIHDDTDISPDWNHVKHAPRENQSMRSTFHSARSVGHVEAYLHFLYLSKLDTSDVFCHF